MEKPSAIEDVTANGGLCVTTMVALHRYRDRPADLSHETVSDSGLDTYMKAYAFSQEAALGEMSPFVTS